MLVALQGKSYEEGAREMGVPVNTFASYFRRARAKLEKILEKELKNRPPD